MRPPRRRPSRRSNATSDPPRRSPRLRRQDMLAEYPYLPEELIDNILVRIRSDDPAGLVKACLGSKFWLRHICTEEFLRRNRELHPRRPALLGFLADTWEGAKPTFVATSTFRLKPSSLPCRYKVIYAQHGRVLFHDRALFDDHRTSFVIWDPITGEKHTAIMPMNEPMVDHWSAVLLCGGDGCNDLRCHDQESTVIFVGTSHMMVTFAAMYSREIDAWDEEEEDEEEEPRGIAHPDAIVDTGPAIVVGRKIYFPCTLSSMIIEYDHVVGTISVVDAPEHGRRIRTSILMMARDGVLGFASVGGSKLNLWSREATTPSGALTWVQYRVLDLAKFQGIRCLLGSGDNIVLVKTGAGVFTINLENDGEYEMVSTNKKVTKAVPYKAFCTPSLQED